MFLLVLIFSMKKIDKIIFFYSYFFKKQKRTVYWEIIVKEITIEEMKLYNFLFIIFM
jgi:hypothetical protein